jgi:uncharacterized membrane-anchored protein
MLNISFTIVLDFWILKMGAAQLCETAEAVY